jgi:hypothetical protein
MNFLKRFSLFEIVLITVILITHLYAALSDAHNFPNKWYSRDDAYYYFKVAQNISEGKGSTFDGINATNGYHPLWMAVCIPIFALARYDLILPLRIMVMVMAGFNAATAVLIYRLIKRNLSTAAAIMAAAFWAFNSYIHSTVYEFGLETPLAALTILLLIGKLSQFESEWRTKKVPSQELALLGAAGILVMFSRLDLVFLVILCGIWVIFRGKPIRFLMPLDMLVMFISVTSSVVLRTGFVEYNEYFAASATNVAIFSLIIKIVCLYFFGLYRHPRLTPIWKTILYTVLAQSIATAAIIGIYLLLYQFGIGTNFPRSAFITDWGISLLGLVMIRLTAYWAGNKNIKIGPQAETAQKELRENWKSWFADGWTYYGLVGGALAAYMLLNKIFFGTFSPVSGQIKRWWGTLSTTTYERPASNWPSFLGFSYQGSFSAWKPASDWLLPMSVKLRPYFPGADYVDERYYIALLIFAMVAALLLALNIRRVLNKTAKMAFVPIFAACLLQIFSYTNTSYAGAKEWYWVSQMILITLTGSLFLDLMMRPVRKFKGANLLLETGAVAFSIYLAFTFSVSVRNAMPYNRYSKDLPYMDVLPFLEENTPPGSVIGMTGGGNIAYYIKDRTIVNMDGLINSNAYFHALKNGEAPAYLRLHGLQIIFANSQLLSVPPYYGQFEPYLSNFGVFGGKGLFYLLEEPKH